MKINKNYLYIKAYILLSLIILFYACRSNQESSSRSVEIEFANPHQSSVIIKNSSNETAVFTLKINGNIYSNTDSIIEAIKNMPESYKGEADYIKAFRFISKNIIHAHSISNKQWGYSPMLILNSTGFGYCGVTAGVLSSLWKELGYNSRVWSLDGHVVPEIEIDKKWHMYDAAYGVYYYNETGTIASVSELAMDPDLITSPKSKDKLPAKPHYNAFSRETASIYSTTENNCVSDRFYCDTYPDKLEFHLMPGAYFEFPGRFTPKLECPQQKKYANYANLKLTIPPDCYGVVSIPLYISSITGSGTIKINNIEYHDNFNELLTDIHNNNSFFSNFEIINGPLEIIYLINPTLTKLKTVNTIDIQGVNIDSLKIYNGAINEAERIIIVDKGVILSDFNNFLEIHDTTKLRYNLVNNPVEDWPDFCNMVDSLLNCPVNIDDTVLNKHEVLDFLTEMKNKEYKDFLLKNANSPEFILKSTYLCNEYNPLEIKDILRIFSKENK